MRERMSIPLTDPDEGGALVAAIFLAVLVLVLLKACT